MMQLLDSLADGKDPSEQEGGAKPTPDLPVKAEEGKGAVTDDPQKVGDSPSGGGVSSEIRVHATVGVVNLLLHSSDAEKELASIFLQGKGKVCLCVSFSVCVCMCAYACDIFSFTELSAGVKVLPDEISVVSGYVFPINLRGPTPYSNFELPPE